MAYTIIKSNGTILATIADGTINTTSTSLALPGRNFAGYGQSLDTNFVHQLENFADTTPPQNPLRGQLWFNTTNNTLYVCPADGTTNAADWLQLSLTSSGGTTTFANVTIQGTLQANSIGAVTSITSPEGVFTNISVSGAANINNATITASNITALTTTTITAGNVSTPGTITGAWTVNGSSVGNALVVNNGNLYANVGIKVNPNNFYDLSGNVIPIGYGNSNVASYLPVYSGNVGTGTATFRGASVIINDPSTANIMGRITATTSQFSPSFDIVSNVPNLQLFAGSNSIATFTVGNIGFGNIRLANIDASLLVSGNANLANISTPGLITATGNIQGGNLRTTGTSSVGRRMYGTANAAASDIFWVGVEGNRTEPGALAIGISTSNAAPNTVNQIQFFTSGNSTLTLSNDQANILGNVQIVGLGKRITGDFLSSVLANRLHFQHNAINSPTAVGALPTGTTASTNWTVGPVSYTVFNHQDPSNAAYASLGISNTEMILGGGRRGTGSNLPLVLYTSESPRININAAGEVAVGGSPIANVLLFANTLPQGGSKVAIRAINSNATIPVNQWFSNTTSGDNRFVKFYTDDNIERGEIFYNRGTGQVTYSTGSDARKKSDIIDSPAASDIISNIKVRSYVWKESNVRINFGFIAQELANTVPEVVAVGDDDPEIVTTMWQIDQSKLIPIMVKALQELNSEVQSLKQQIANLQGD